MKVIRRVTMVVSAGLVVAACGPAGSGNIVSEPREVDAFDSIQISGGVDLALIVDDGAEASVTVVYDDNLQERIITELEGTTLVVRSRGTFNVVGEGRHLEVVAPTLNELSASGGSDVDGDGVLESMILDASGGSDVDLSDLEVTSMIVNISGGSDATVNVTEEIEGNASGGSDLTILGDPANQRVEVSGGSEVSNG